MAANSSFLVVPVVILFCGIALQWSTVEAQTRCPPLKKLANGSMTGKCNGTAGFYDTCSFSCNSGYHLKGSSSILCNFGDTWSEPPPVCVNSCPPLNSTANTFLSGKCNGTVKSWDRCTFSCASGFALSGNKELTCQYDYEWNNPVPSCERTCPDVRLPQNSWKTGTCSGGLIRSGSKCTIFCNKGYFIKGKEELTCTTSYKWNYDIPTCERSCPNIPRPEGARMNGMCSDVLIEPGRQCTFSCVDDKYILIGEKDLTCSSTYKWNFDPPSCVKPCTNVTRPENGNMNGKCQGAVRPGDKCSFTCLPGFVMKRNQEITCRGNSGWNGEPALCLDSCPPLTSNTDTTLSGKCNGTVKSGDRCTFSCASGLVLDGSEQLTCKNNYDWDKPTPRCERTCPDVSPPQNGRTSGTCSGQPIKGGSICRITCNQGYYPKGKSELMCSTGYKWNYKTPICERSCPEIINPGRAWMSPQCSGGPILPGTRCTLSCPNEGTILQGERELTCNDNYQWNYPTPSCVRTCPNVSQPRDSVISGTCSGRISPNDKCRFNCSAGLRLRGEKEITCQANYLWSKESPTCVNNCETLVPGADMESSGRCSGAKVGERCVFTCPRGYRLEGAGELTCKQNLQWDRNKPSCVSGAAATVASFITLVLSPVLAALLSRF